MKAVRVNDTGSADSLILSNIPVPEPKKNEVAIDVAFAGVGFCRCFISKWNISASDTLYSWY